MYLRARGTYYIRAQERFYTLLSKCKNKYGCVGVAYNERYTKPWSASIFNKLIGRYKLREDAIVARMMANISHNLNSPNLIDARIILRDIFAQDVVYAPQTLKIDRMLPGYVSLVKQDAIENACRVDPTKEYSSIGKAIDELGY